MQLNDLSFGRKQEVFGQHHPVVQINRYQSKHFLENNNKRTYGVRVLCFGGLDY
jgi:hypothetical protein